MVVHPGVELVGASESNLSSSAFTPMLDATHIPRANVISVFPTCSEDGRERGPPRRNARDNRVKRRTEGTFQPSLHRNASRVKEESGYGFVCRGSFLGYFARSFGRC